MSEFKGLLDGVSVLESGDEPAVRFCGWMLAANGATVFCRTPQESSDRYSTDFLDSGKSYADDTVHVDIVIADPDYDWESVPAKVITGTVYPFRPTGPYADWTGNELVYSSLGGASGYTVSREGVPAYGYGDRYQYLAGQHLFQGVTASYLQRLIDPESATGAAPLVEVSNFETVVTTLPYPTTQYQYNGDESVLEQSGPRFVSRCSDGFVVIYAGFAWDPIAATIGRDDLLTDERFVENDARFRHVAELGEVFDDWAAARTVEQACNEGKTHNVAVTPVRPAAEALRDEDLLRRGVFTLDRSGEGLVPAIPYTVNGHRSREGRDA
ncbi:CoA transferase [Cumulibacter soli]|uniref:CoA transferase n=1 Tax=Cumulibacter soli TaxID=2546344 RepID=UPI0010686513|nr:CoA transferase [Cumulibacter soli]